MTSPVVAASERHSTSPLPGRTGTSGRTASRATTRAPGGARPHAVASVEPESTTTSSSTSVPSSGRTAATTPPTVASSFSAGSTTDTVRAPLAAIRSSASTAGAPTSVGRTSPRPRASRCAATCVIGPGPLTPRHVTPAPGRCAPGDVAADGRDHVDDAAGGGDLVGAQHRAPDQAATAVAASVPSRRSVTSVVPRVSPDEVLVRQRHEHRASRGRRARRGGAAARGRGRCSCRSRGSGRRGCARGRPRRARGPRPGGCTSAMTSATTSA